MSKVKHPRLPDAAQVTARSLRPSEASTRIIAYRAGGDDDSPTGLFFADCYDAAWLFAIHSGRPVVEYEISVSKHVEWENQFAWWAAKTGLTTEEVRNEFHLLKDPYSLRKLDRRIRDELSAQGIEAVRYTVPTTPNAKWELVVFDRRHCRPLREMLFPSETPRP